MTIMTEPTFTHLLNPFQVRTGSSHQVANELTWRTLGHAHASALQQGLEIEILALVLPGDEASVQAPATRTLQLPRSVLDVAALRPPRPLPLIGDILTAGANASQATHLIFSNMDIAVQPHFYSALREIVVNQVGTDTPFAVPRLNIDAALANGPLEAMYDATGPIGIGYDCFVIPRQAVFGLDMGHCCIGAPHFDNLLMMQLDALSPRGVRHLVDERLTFHLGNDIAWSAMLDYVEHNLRESLAGIRRFRASHGVVPGGYFDRVDKGHFQRNAKFSSMVLRKIKRVPGLTRIILSTKRALGRQY